MRALLIIAIIVGLMIFGGWLAFDFSGNRASVEVNTDKIEQDAERAWDGSKELLHKADDAINEPTTSPSKGEE
jgi:hypothetical protein